MENFFKGGVMQGLLFRDIRGQGNWQG